MNVIQPDVKLLLDEHGVIQEASVSSSFSKEGLAPWVGQLWSETVEDTGREKIISMLADARRGGVSGFRQINQRFPSGAAIPIEYTTVWLGGPNASAVAIGRNLRTVAELQSRLISVQQALERDYWKLRDIETRYRQLFEASNEAVILVRADNLRLVEANPAAMRALGLPPQRPGRAADRELLGDILAEERGVFEAMLMRAREQGKAPAVLVHLGPAGEPWMVRASSLPSEVGATFLLQLTPTGLPADAAEVRRHDGIEALIQRAPDAFVVIDRDGRIQRANPAFLDMVQVGSERAVEGQPLERWLARSGADLGMILANLRRLGTLRLFPTTLRGELGTELQVEVSACADRDEDPQSIGIMLRDVGRRGTPVMSETTLGTALDPLARQIGTTPMRKLVGGAVEVMETHFIRSALELTGGNRTAAAELLGLSRQSLYAKLGRYGLDTNTRADSEQPD